MTPDDIAAIEARADAATKGPWTVEVDVDPRTGNGADFIHSHAAGAVIAYSNDRGADDEFIAHARQDVPALIVALRERDATLDRVRELAEGYAAESIYDTDAGTAAEIFAAIGPQEEQ